MSKQQSKGNKPEKVIDLGKASTKEFEALKVEDFENINQDLTFSALQNIKDKEPEFYKALSEAIIHLNGTYSDKYEAVKSIVDTKQMLYDPEIGKYLSLYQTMRYVQRFFAPGAKFDKGENKKDILKAIHYLLFHTVMLNRKGDTKNIDLKG